jgi:hypothetical protein
MTDTDDGLKFRMAVCNAAGMQWLNRTGVYQPPSRQILKLLSAFTEEKINAVARVNSTEALRAASELREALRSLVYGFKHPEFKSQLETLEAQMHRIGRACLEHLVIRSITVKQPEEIEECRQLLEELISEGYWPEWETEIEEIIDRYCAAKKAS